jgi:hypothetical protein
VTGSVSGDQISEGILSFKLSTPHVLLCAQTEQPYSWSYHPRN